MLALEFAAFWLSGQWISGSTVVTPVKTGDQYKSWLITCDDADTLIAINHGFVNKYGVATAPDSVTLEPQESNAASPEWARQVTATQIILSKLPAAGSGGAAVLKVVAMAPHTIIQ